MGRFFLRPRGQPFVTSSAPGALTVGEVERVAPNLNHYLWRPILADPPLYGPMDLRTLTLVEVMDANEALDLRDARAIKAQRAAEAAKGR